MRNLLVFAFLALFIPKNAQSSDLEKQSINIHKKGVVNLGKELFETGSQFSAEPNNDVVLKVNFSQPIIREVSVINHDDLSDSSSTPCVVKWVEKNTTCFDIHYYGTNVGRVETDIFTEEKDEVYIRFIEVNSEYQKKGIATKAIDLVVRFYLQQTFEIKTFFAQIEPSNHASIKVFTKNKFEKNSESVSVGLLPYLLTVEDYLDK